MVRKLVLGLAAALLLVAMAGTAGADEQETLAGYIGVALGAGFSVQPIFPGLLPTGDAPFEVTGALSLANVKSGGNAYAQADAGYPGAAAANTGPLIGTAANQPLITQAVPPYPAGVQANQDQGRVSQGVAPGPVLSAEGAPGKAIGIAQVGSGGIPTVITVDDVVSDSRSFVENGKLITQSTVTVKGVKLGAGSVTIDSVKSVAKATSDGTSSTQDGSTVISGLKVGGQAAELSSAGLKAAGLPDGTAAMNQVLKGAGISMEVTQASGHSDGGSADRVSNGVIVTIANPAAAANPQFVGSRFVVLLAPTAVGALASPPFDSSATDVTDITDISGVGGGVLPALGSSGSFNTFAGSVSNLFGSEPATPGHAAGGRTSVRPIGFQPARNVLDPVGGIPGGLLVGIGFIGVIGARRISRYIGRFVSSEE